MLHLTLVLLVDGLHDKAHQHRAFAAQFLQIDFLRIVRAVQLLAVMDEVAHLHIEQQRFGGIFHVEGIETPVLDVYKRQVIESVEEMAEEGRTMHHCVGGYHKRKDSLIPVSYTHLDVYKRQAVHCSSNWKWT